MGWAIRRVDGTYRCWNRNAQDDLLLPAETWEERAASPAITAGPVLPSPLARAVAKAKGSKTVDDILDVLDLLVKG